MIKKTIAAFVLVTVLGLGLAGSSTVLAETTTQQNPMTSLAKKIADKFNLNQADVEAVMHEDREAHHQEMEAKFETQLSQFVTDGKLTEAKKQLILAKHKELQASRESKRDSMQNLTRDARKSQMDAERTQLEAWAKQNGIDMQYLMPQGRGGHHGGFGRHGAAAPATTTPTPAQ